MLSGSRISWTNEASTNVSSFTMCVKTSRSFAVNSFFADSLIRKRTTSVILSGMASPLGEAQIHQMLYKGACYRGLKPRLQWVHIYQSACSTASLFVSPLIGKCHRRPTIASPLLMQPSQARKQHVRPRDQDSLARKLRQQLIPCRRSRSRVAIENHRDFGMRQLDALYVDDAAPEQDH